MEGRKEQVVINLICSIFGALIGGIKYINKPKNAFSFYGCNFAARWSPTCAELRSR
jgi:hypothetical protein